MKDTYRPETFAEIVGQPTDEIEAMIDGRHTPNFLFYGPQGTGKTSAARVISRELQGSTSELMEFNASDERGIDTVRDRIIPATNQTTLTGAPRVIFLDEMDSMCVPPGTPVVTGYPSKPTVKPIEEVSEGGEPMPSVNFDTNEVQSDRGRRVDSGVADFFRMTVSDGREIVASPTHPFFVVEDGQLVERELRDLEPGDEIADYTQVGVRRCEACGSWTGNARFCSMGCKDKGHQQDMSGKGNPMHGETWSEERREKTVSTWSDGRRAGENNPNYDGEFHGTRPWDMDEETQQRVREAIRSAKEGKSYAQIFSSEREREERLKRGEGGLDYRYHLRDMDETECEICGDVISVGGSDGIYVHHIDGDRSNNDESNLLDVCPTCHNTICHPETMDRLEAGWQENPARTSDGGRAPVDTAAVKSIEYDHRGSAYNITMEGTPNFILGNGVLTHNTKDAQQALRQPMEQSDAVFVLACNEVEAVHDAVISRCHDCEFGPVPDAAIKRRIRQIADGEGVDLSSDQMKTIVAFANGDVRNAIQRYQQVARGAIEAESETIQMDSNDLERQSRSFLDE